MRGISACTPKPEQPLPVQEPAFREIKGEIEQGETLSGIFKKYNLDIGELYRIRQASAGIYRLRDLHPGRSYRIVLDNNERIDSFHYGIDDNCVLSINRTDEGYCAEKVPIAYERRILHIGGTIRDNLIASMEGGNGGLLLALQLSDIFAWDIDFTTDLRNDDTFKMAVEGLYRDGKFKKYGAILGAEFINNGDVYRAYAFDQNGKTDYYDETGKALRKSLLEDAVEFQAHELGLFPGEIPSDPEDLPPPPRSGLCGRNGNTGFRRRRWNGPFCRSQGAVRKPDHHQTPKWL